jgi:2-phosphoglycerate kinase
MALPQRSWDVLLIGGASGVGKSSVSYRLAQHFGVALIEVDDFQVILERMTTPQQYPALHFWRTHPDPTVLAPQTLVDNLIGIALELQPALEVVIANHLETDRPAVLEGDFILPALAAQSAYGDFENGGRVRSIIVSEPDVDQIVQNYLLREPDAGVQQFRAEISTQYDAWLRREAEQLGVPAIPARPWETAFERILAALSA